MSRPQVLPPGPPNPAGGGHLWHRDLYSSEEKTR
jgi:hypothetical protein